MEVEGLKLRYWACNGVSERSWWTDPSWIPRQQHSACCTCRPTL